MTSFILRAKVKILVLLANSSGCNSLFATIPDTDTPPDTKRSFNELAATKAGFFI